MQGEGNGSVLDRVQLVQIVSIVQNVLNGLNTLNVLNPSLRQPTPFISPSSEWLQ